MTLRSLDKYSQKIKISARFPQISCLKYWVWYLELKHKGNGTWKIESMIIIIITDLTNHYRYRSEEITTISRFHPYSVPSL